MKVLFSIDSLQQGGAEQSIAHIIKHFSPETQVTILYFYPKADLIETYRALGCKIIALNMQEKYGWRKGIKGMRKVLKEEQPDLVVTSLYRSNIISRIACKLSGIKLIGTFVDDSYNEERRKTFRGIGQIKYQITWLVDRLTSGIPIGWISNSRYIGENNAKKLGIPMNRIHVVYRGRDSKGFNQWQKPEGNEFRFVCIGRLYEKKGYPELIQAFAQLHHAFPNAILDIYGEGSYRPEMEKMIASLNMQKHIILHGNVPGAWMKLYESHCFVFPSRFEGFSGALVEAMMTGIPIISSDIPMNLEAVENNKTALVHRLKDVNDLADKMKLMMEQYPNMMEMGNRAREISFNRFDILVISKQYEGLLQQFADKK